MSAGGEASVVRHDPRSPDGSAGIFPPANLAGASGALLPELSAVPTLTGTGPTEGHSADKQVTGA